MNQRREFPELSGKLFGTLRVGALAGIHPQVRYQVRCEQCGTSSTETFQRITSNAPCRNSACSKGAIRERLAETPARNRRRLEEEAANREHAAQKAIASQLASAEAQLIKNHRSLAKESRELITRQPDPNAYVDPATVGIKMTAAQAEEHNGRACVDFIAATPSYYPTPENWSALYSYMERNGIRIYSVSTLKAAFDRLHAAGLLEHRPARPAVGRTPPVPPQPAPHPIELPAASPSVGWNPATGERMEYTQYQIGRMTSDEFKRAFRLHAEPPPPFSLQLR